MKKFVISILVLLLSFMLTTACTRTEMDDDTVEDDTYGTVDDVVDEDKDIEEDDVPGEEVVDEGKDEDIPEDIPDEEQEEEPKDAGLGTRENPYPLGEKVLVDYTDFAYGKVQIEVTVNNLIRGEEAEQIVVNEDEFNEPSGEGKEYVIANIMIKLIDIEEGEFYSEYGYEVPYFEWVSVTGRTYDELIFPLIPDELLGTLYKGGEKTGNIITRIDEGDEVLVKLGSKWFALQN